MARRFTLHCREGLTNLNYEPSTSISDFRLKSRTTLRRGPGGSSPQPNASALTPR